MQEDNRRGPCDDQDISPALCWFALQTRSRHEKTVRDRLLAEGFEPLLPITRRLRQWSDRKREIEVPLFAGYCFIRFSLPDKTMILRTPGVVRIVGGPLLPEPIPDEEIESIRQLTTSRSAYASHPYLVEGTPVKVIRGPLAGVNGRLIRKEGRDQLVIRVHLIQQAAAVHINAADVAPADGVV